MIARWPAPVIGRPASVHGGHQRTTASLATKGGHAYICPNLHPACPPPSFSTRARRSTAASMPVQAFTRWGVQVPRELNVRQQQVLLWVGQGCPDDVWEGTAHKLSCQALHSRGLVKVSRRQGQWSVALTKAGQQYLDDGSFPLDHPRSRNTVPAPRAGTLPPDVAEGEKPSVKASLPAPSPDGAEAWITDLLQTRWLRFVAGEGEHWKVPSPTALPFNLVNGGNSRSEPLSPDPPA